MRSGLVVRVLKPFGYWDFHEVGETINLRMVHANQLIKAGYVEVVVNNLGNNLAYDETPVEELAEKVTNGDKEVGYRSTKTDTALWDGFFSAVTKPKA